MKHTKYTLPFAALLVVAGPPKDAAQEAYNQFFNGKNKRIEQVVQTPTSRLEGLLEGSVAYGEENYVKIDQFYNMAIPVKGMYAGVRAVPPSSLPDYVKSDLKGLKINPNEWYDAYDKDGALKDILKKDLKINFPYLDKFLTQNKKEIVTIHLFREGYLTVLLNRKGAYIFPIEPSTIDKIEKL